MKPFHGWICATTAFTLFSLTVLANDPVESQATQTPSTQPATSTTSADETIKQLLAQSQPPRPQASLARTVDPTKPIAPTTSAHGGHKPTQPIRPYLTSRLDPAVIGTAPGGTPPALQREGDFVISRRGRLIRSPDSNHRLFLFEADDRQSPEPPMVLLPCQKLETMENLVEDRGDTIVFVLTGQITTYRGVNYILPTMIKPAFNPPNLR